MSAIGTEIARQLAAAQPFLTFFGDSEWARRRVEPGNSDFVLGNPHEMPLAGFVSALRTHSEPENKDWFAYKQSEPEARRVVAESLQRQRSVAFDPDDILMTNGAFAGLAIVLRAIVDRGDEVIYNLPPWFFYEPIILAAGAEPVRIRVRPDGFDLDLDAVAAAITPRTRAIIVNSPNNPTGVIYPAATLDALGKLLEDASRRNGRPIYLVSDEAYCRIVFDGRRYVSPTEHYPYSFLVYTYGKTLLTPGQRLGYVALPPQMSDRPLVREALFMAQAVTGYAWPNALLQHALGEIELLSIDIGHLQRKRDRLVEELGRMGYHVHVPEGTFYLMPQSPIPDDGAMVTELARHRVFVLPGSIFELPGYFRISLTANDEMIDRALPGFARAIDAVRVSA